MEEKSNFDHPGSNGELVLDNTKRGMFMQCKKKYFFSAKHGIQPRRGSTALRYGVTWHAIMEGFFSWVAKNGWPKNSEALGGAITAGLLLGKKAWDKETESKMFVDDYRNFNTAVEMFDNYLEYFANDERFLDIISTESKFQCPIEAENELEERLLETLPPIVFTGRIDLCVEMDSMKWILDFKTTGWRLDEVILKANRSPQLIGYSYAGARVLDFKPTGCLISFAFAGSRKSPKTGEYGATKYDFRRVPQIYTAGDIQAWKIAFIDTCREIVRAEEMDCWPESFDNCYQFGPCPYLRLCKQHAPFEELNLDDYRIEFWDVLDEG